MADLPRELQEVTRFLSRWVAAQQRLGARAAPRRGGRLPRRVERPDPLPPGPPAASALTLEDVRAELGDCRRCKLAPRRTNIVFGQGPPQARLLFIGEAPGADEDLQGQPFVGAAGELLDRLLNRLGLPRTEVYIANIVKCRPPGNRNPEPDEIAACLPFLLKQIEAIRPRLIVTLGAVATHTLLDTNAPINRLRGQWQAWRDGIRVMPTFHPSYLLRAPRERKKTWEDMQLVMAAYREPTT